MLSLDNLLALVKHGALSGELLRKFKTFKDKQTVSTSDL
jgi:hypothetical protein